MLGALGYRDKEVIKTLAILSTLRGEDSAGAVVVPRKGGAPVVMKTVGTSFDLFNLSLWEKTSFYDKQAVIGHTRKATIGGITKSAAHPFSYDHVHGVHNGTLQRWASLPCGAEVSDSSTLFKNISESGLRDTIERVGGAYAVVFYDENENTINFLRNKERSLFYAFSEDYSRVIWASEHWMIWAACQRGDLKLANLAKAGEEAEFIVAVETDTWIKVRVKETGIKEVITFLEDEALVGDVIKPEVQKYSHPFHTHGQGGLQNRVPFDYEKRQESLLKLAPPDTTPTAGASASTQTTSPAPSPTTSTSSASPHPRPTLSLVAGSSASGSKQSTESKSQPEPIEYVLADDLDDDLPASLRVVLDSNGLPMSREAFESITDSKCCFCGVDVDYEDALEHAGGAKHIPGIGLWADPERFVCTTCVPAAR